MASTQKAKIPVGFVIAGKYRVTGELGRGGMAAVYEAENVDIGKRVAIKVLAQELISSTVVVERFLREARAVAAIRSPYICDVYDSGRLEDGRPFLVLELLEGESLYERMVRVGPIDVETTVTVMAQTCRGLTRAHAAGIVHRDLKPENIFVTKDEEGALLCKILDFGLAKFYQPMEDGAAQARLTREGAVFGTPAYMSPEQVRGQGAVDARADLWALGCITYECLTGRTVWSTEQGVAMTFAQIAQGNVPDPLTFRPDLPDSFREWFKKSLHKDIAQRFQTPKEFAEELMVATNVAMRGSEHSSDLTAQLRGGLESAILSPRDRSPAGSRAGTRPSLGGTAAPSSAGIVPTPLAHETSPNAPSGGAADIPSIPPAMKGGGGGKLLLTVGFAALLGAGGYFAYRTMVPPSAANGTAATADAGTEAAPTSTVIASTDATATPLAHDTGGLPFRPLIAEAQEMISKGDLEGAREKIRQATDLGGHYTPQTFGQHLDAVKNGNKGAPNCKLTGLARPRSYDLFEEKPRRIAAGAPSIAVGVKGAIVVWTEPSDGVELAHAVALDESLRARTKPFVVSPEGELIQRPQIYPMGDRFLLTYWDTRPPNILARYLDADGRIETGQKTIATAPGGASSPTVTMLPDKNLLFVWVEPSDKLTEDIYARKFTTDLDPIGEKIRLTAFTPRVTGRTRPRFPTVGVDGEAVRITYKLERDPDRFVQHLRIPFASLNEGGVNATGMGPRTPDRFIGKATLVSKPRMRTEQPTMACSSERCFSVWHEEGHDGIWAGLLQGDADPLFAREVVPNSGKNPGIGTNSKGLMQVFWYERGKGLVTAGLNRDGMTDGSTVARMTSVDRPAPSVSAGLKDNEWYAAWTDFEAGMAEVFAVRVECK
ncbi:MAG: serine/threonine protein kinase [Polyangiaceae bacterium]|nr:serine/threonine protein kinase [Polyangiaceae bacterium]